MRLNQSALCSLVSRQVKSLGSIYCSQIIQPFSYSFMAIFDLTISDRLFDWLNDSEGMGIVDLNADEWNSLPTVRTEDGNVFEIVCRKAEGKEDGWMSAN